MYEINFGQMFIGIKGVGKGDGERGHVPPHFQKCVGTIGFVPPPLFVTELRHLELAVRRNLHIFYQ